MNNEDVFMSYIKWIAGLGVVAAIILVIGVSLINLIPEQENSDPMIQNAIEQRLKPVEVVNIKDPNAAPAVVAADNQAAAGSEGGKSTYEAICAACHGMGVLQAPKFGDKEAWTARLDANGGIDGLVQSAINGKGAMPARGGNASLSDEDLKAAIEYMMQ